MNENDWSIVELHSINTNINNFKSKKHEFTTIYNSNKKTECDMQNKTFFSLKNTIKNNPEEEGDSSIFYEETIRESSNYSKLTYKINIKNEYEKVEILNVSCPDNNSKDSKIKKSAYSKSKLFIIEFLRKAYYSENFLFFCGIFFAILMYFLSLERCLLENEFKCWNLFYPKIKILAVECFIASLIIAVLYANLIIFKKKFFTKQNFILYISHLFLFFADEGIDFTGNHGGYNRLFLNVFITASLICTFISYSLYKIAKRIFICIVKKIEKIELFNSNYENIIKFKRKNFIIGTIIVLFICIYYMYRSIRIKLASTCNDWDKGFKNSKLDKETNCSIEKPLFCYNEVFDGVFDFSKYFATCKFHKIHNVDVVNKFYNYSKFVEFPDTRKIEIEDKDSLSVQLNIKKELKFISIEDYLNTNKSNKTKTYVYLNRTDPDINRHHFIYDIEYNEELIKEAERKRFSYKAKQFTKENKEIYNQNEFEDYLMSKKINSKFHISGLNELDFLNNKTYNTLKNNKSKISNSSYLRGETTIEQLKEHSNETHLVNFINYKSEKILQNIFFQKNEVLIENVIFIFLDTLSRQQFKRKLPQVFKYLESFYKNKSSTFESFQFLKYHATQASTDFTMRPLYLGTHPLQNETAKAFLHTYFKDKGFITGHSLNQCLNFEISYDKREPHKKFIWKDYDFEFYSPFCDPSYVEYGKETAFLYGPYSFFRKCLYGKDTFQYALDWGSKFFSEVYSNQRKYLALSFIDGHEWTNESIKYLDYPLFNFLSEILEKTTNEKNNNINQNTAVVLLSDHGLHMNGPSLLLSFEDVEKEKLLPVFNIILPRNLADSYIGKALELNENRIIGGYDIHNIFKTLAGSVDFSIYGEQPFKVMPNSRSCVNLGVPDKNCLCKKGEN